MSKYQPLADHLANLNADQWRPTFHELERTLGFDLPKGARKAAWWTGSDTSQAAVWRTEGWEIDPEHLNLDRETVAFRRVRPLEETHRDLEPIERERRAADDIFDHETGASTFQRVATGGAVAAGLLGLAVGVGVIALRGVLDRRR